MQVPDKNSALAEAALIGWLDVDRRFDEIMNAWYDEEHLPERLGVPGFLRGRRFEASDGPWRYFTIYEAASTAVFRSPAYLARLDDPTPRTRAIGKHISSRRGAYVTRVSRGVASGSWLVVIRLDDTLALDDVPGDDVLGAICEQHGVHGAHVLELEPKVTAARAETHEGRSNPTPAEQHHLLVVVDCADEHTAEQVLAAGDMPVMLPVAGEPAPARIFRLRADRRA